MSLINLATTLLSAGPELIRAAGNLLGHTDVSEAAIAAIDAIQGDHSDRREQEIALMDALENVPAVDLAKLMALQTELEAQLTARHQATQQTIQNGDNAADPKVRLARPVVAVLSMLSAGVYVVLMEVLEAMGHGSGAELYWGGLLVSCAAGYMGLRYREKTKGIAG